MFDQLKMAPPDPIRGVQEAFDHDPNPNKVNLSSGVYKDRNGKTPILRVVKQVEKKLVADETDKTYLGIAGSPEFGAVVQQLLFDEDSELVAEGRAVTVQTPGGTGGLRVAADLIAATNRNTSIWLSDPTWPNHQSIFAAAGLSVRSYPYRDPTNHGLAFDALLGRVKQLATGDILVLHACCHNPTGIDPSPEQWAELANVVRSRRVIPLLDFAYQGFGDGLREDRAGLMALSATVPELLIAQSFSKNFGLYNERVGALTFVGRSSEVTQVTLSHIKRSIRANYSTPPAHGAAIVTRILLDASYRREWERELGEMRGRINAMRQLLTDSLTRLGVRGDFSAIQQQRGMFYLSGLDRDQVRRLRDEYSVHIVGSGRINVAGLTEANMNYVCRAIAAVS